MQLVKDNDPILKQLAIPWDFDKDTNPEDVERTMIDIMSSQRGRGLAANQVGLLKRVFVIQLEGQSNPIAMFNPVLLSSSSDETDVEEGCLSFPGLFIFVRRPERVEVEYLDKHKNSCKITLTGIDARCFLHELDHLNGVCFTEKVSKLKLMLAKKKQRKYNGRTK